ncbi:722_t:CDS:2, partial [Diversispora eburnea]
MNLPTIKVQFPPRVTVEEIVQKQLDNNIKNVNHTPNSFLIYRREFNNEIHKSQVNLKLEDISKLAAVSWKTEPQQIKNYYKKLAKEVKNSFKKRVQSLCFIDESDKSNKKRKKIATSNNISFNNDSPSYSIFTPLLSQSFQNQNESISPIAIGSNVPLIPIYQNYEFIVNTNYSPNHPSQNHDYSNSNISLPYSFITPLSGQPSQYINYVNTNEYEFINFIDTNNNISLNNYSLYSSLTPLSESYEDKFISPIATGNISPYTSSHSPLTSLSGQSSQYIVSNDVNSVDNSPYSHYLTPILINPLNILYLTN